jgi:addiction module RelE/StbE family toxin
MKRVVFHKNFDKSFVKRIKNSPKMREQFNSRLQLFISGEREYPINDHPLTGNMSGQRSFSIANDLRVIYEETESEIIFLDIGSHSQVYR